MFALASAGGMLSTLETMSDFPSNQQLQAQPEQQQLYGPYSSQPALEFSIDIAPKDSAESELVPNSNRGEVLCETYTISQKDYMDLVLKGGCSVDFVSQDPEEAHRMLGTDTRHWQHKRKSLSDEEVSLSEDFESTDCTGYMVKPATDLNVTVKTVNIKQSGNNISTFGETSFQGGSNICTLGETSFQEQCASTVTCAV
jgi:hypothetical protein